MFRKYRTTVLYIQYNQKECKPRFRLSLRLITLLTSDHYEAVECCVFSFLDCAKRPTELSVNIFNKNMTRQLWFHTVSYRQEVDPVT